MFCDDVEGWFGFDDYIAYVDIVKQFHNGNFVEVGCWKGRSFCSILPTLIGNNYQNIYAVDHWLGSEDSRQSTHIEATYTDIFQQFKNNIDGKGFTGKYKALQLDSIEASRQFEDKFFDVVFIDGYHEYEGISADLDAWTPKVKLGGILCGHDGTYSPIVKALTERFQNNWSIIAGGVWMTRI